MKTDFKSWNKENLIKFLTYFEKNYPATLRYYLSEFEEVERGN